MDMSTPAVSGSTPPPPLPRRILTYEPPNTIPSIRWSANMETFTGSNSPVSPRAGPSPRTAGAIYPTSHGTAIQGRIGQQSQQTYSSSGPSAPNLQTLCFYDHLRRLALMVLASEPILALATPPSPPGMHTGGCSASSTPRQPCTPMSPPPLACGTNSELERPQISIQLYLHGSPAFNSEHGLRSADYWCRQLQFSTAFQYFTHELRKHRGISQTLPTVRIEAYDALPTYSTIIHHSLNEREYRGLQQCHDHTESFLRYMKRMTSNPDFVMPDDVAAKGTAYLQNRLFVKEQMEDIRNGDGGKNRRRRAVLREQLAPAFDDGSGPEGKEETTAVGPTWSFNRIQTSRDQSVPHPVLSPYHMQSPNLQSPQRLNLSPGQGQQDTDTQHNHQPLSPARDPTLCQRGPLQQNQQQQSPGQSNVPHQPNQKIQSHPSSQGLEPITNPMPPPPTPAQGWQRPGPTKLREGSLANPFELNPFPLHIKSMYRGVSQPYHNMVLVIDQPQRANAAGIGVLRFGYESDWAKGESIQRSGACFERVSMTKGTGRRWLGDALVECFTGDASENVPSPSSGDDGNGSRLTWAGRDGRTDVDFGLGIERMAEGSGFGFGIDMEQMDEETARMLKQLSVPGAENVDFLEREWCGLL